MPRRRHTQAQGAVPAAADGGGSAGKRHEGKTRPPYPPAFRAEAVRLTRSGGAPLVQIARDLGISQDTLRLWVKQAQVEVGEREGLTGEERAELARLRRENRVLREEREILKKATAFFAAEGATR